MNTVEYQYKELLKKTLNGSKRNTRNDNNSPSIFGEMLTINDVANFFPLLTSREIRYKGVFGELAAFLRSPKSLTDFQKFGCNYWKSWADEDGSIRVDYGNLWTDYNGVNQLADVIHKLKHNPYDRRMIIDTWRPDKLNELSLPCCHFLYQFYYDENGVSMIWYQRSVDIFVGLPSDIVLAALMLIFISNECGLKPNSIKMFLGDIHCYSTHLEMVEKYLNNDIYDSPTYKLNVPVGSKFTEFTPNWLSIIDYNFAETLSPTPVK